MVLRRSLSFIKVHKPQDVCKSIKNRQVETTFMYSEQIYSRRNLMQPGFVLFFLIKIMRKKVFSFFFFLMNISDSKCVATTFSGYDQAQHLFEVKE